MIAGKVCLLKNNVDFFLQMNHLLLPKVAVKSLKSKFVGTHTYVFEKFIIL